MVALAPRRWVNPARGAAVEGKRVLAVNSGNYVLLPTPAGRAMVSHWAGAAAEFFPRK